MIAVLGPFIVRHPEVKGNMEQFMVQHVLPEFTAQEAYLRSVVCLQTVHVYLPELTRFRHVKCSV